MTDPFVAEIRLFPGNFAPKGWALTNGQLMAISQNTALFSLVGTLYGGDGKSNFALPDFRSRMPMDQGQGAGLSPTASSETQEAPRPSRFKVVAIPSAPRRSRFPPRSVFDRSR